MTMRFAAAALAFLALGATTPALGAGKRHVLPADVAYPEGIAYDARSRTLYTVGSTSAAIAHVDARTGKVTTVVAKDVASQIGDLFPAVLGLKVDARGRLWMAGGRTGKVFVVDPRTGRLIQTIATPGEGGLINDVAFAGGKAFFTDTFRGTLWAADAGADIPATPEAWVEFKGTPLEYAQGANLNGILATPDGRSLITGQMNKGLLYRIDVASKQVTPIAIGGEKVEGADGLILQGRTLYVIRQPAAEIVTVQLSPDLTWGGVVKRTKTEGLLWPATGVIVGGELVVVNTQFNKRGTNDPETPFSLQRVPLSELAGR